jgi:hypothetical protein
LPPHFPQLKSFRAEIFPSTSILLTDFCGPRLFGRWMKAMKTTQAWVWLTAAVMAAGLNASYHDGGFRWAHRAIAQAEHCSRAVLALATGRADEFLSEARMELAAARGEDASCPRQAAAARLQAKAADAESGYAWFQAQVADGEAGFAQIEAMTALQQAAFARVQAMQVRFEARAEARAAARVARCRVREIAPAAFVQIMTPTYPQVRVPRIPEIRIPAVQVPRIQLPSIQIPAMQVPAITIDATGAGPV